MAIVPPYTTPTTILPILDFGIKIDKKAMICPTHTRLADFLDDFRCFDTMILMLIITARGVKSHTLTKASKVCYNIVMRARFGVPLFLVGAGLYLLTMILINNHIGVHEPVSANSEVAGITTTRTPQYVPTSTSTLTAAINSARLDNKLGELVEDSRLNAIALERATDMVNQSYYSHSSPQQTTFADYFSRYSIPITTYSCENLLLAQNSNPDVAVAEWVASPAHASCMEDYLMTRVGVAAVSFDRTTGQQLFVAIFAEGI
jgi:uncharacterized protein YkwD